MNYHKLLSGKFWLTIISGLVFMYGTYKGILGGEAVSAIISMVFISYFQRNTNGANKPA
jgi:hypothetical protein